MVDSRLGVAFDRSELRHYFPVDFDVESPKVIAYVLEALMAQGFFIEPSDIIVSEPDPSCRLSNNQVIFSSEYWVYFGSRTIENTVTFVD